MLPGQLSEHQKIGKRVAAQAVRPIDSRSALARGEEAGHVRHLGIRIHPDAAHDVVGGGAHFHGDLRDVDVGELLELVVHGRKFSFDVLDRIGEMFPDPADIEEHSAVGRAAARFDLAHDAARHVVAGQEFGWPARVLVPLGVSPALFGGVRGLGFVVVGNVSEHEPFAVLVPQHAAFAPDPFGDQETADGQRPHHPGGMELDELHVHQFGARFIREGMAVSRAFPTVAGDLERAPDAPGGEDDGAGPEDLEAPARPFVGQGSGDPVAILQEGYHRALHMNVHPEVDGVILQRADQFETRPVSHVGEAGIAVAAEISLEDLAVGCAVENRPPGLEFTHALWRFAGVEFGHPPVVDVLASAHGVREMDFPVVALIDVGEGGRDTALGHDRVRFPEQGLAHEADRDPLRPRFDGRAEARAPRADDQDVVFDRGVFSHLMVSRVRFG